MRALKLRLIEGIGVAGRFRDPVADALRAGTRDKLPVWVDRLPECGSRKASRRLSRRLLRDKSNCGDNSSKKKRNYNFACQGLKSPKRTRFLKKQVPTTELHIAAKLDTLYTR